MLDIQYTNEAERSSLNRRSQFVFPIERFAFSLLHKSNFFDQCPSDEDIIPTVLFVRTETVMRPAAAPIFNNRIIKIMEGRSFSSVDAEVPAAASSLLLSMLNGSIVAGAAAAGAEVLNQDGEDILI